MYNVKQCGSNSGKSRYSADFNCMVKSTKDSGWYKYLSIVFTKGDTTLHKWLLNIYWIGGDFDVRN